MRVGILMVLVACLVSTVCAEELGSSVTGEAKTAFLTTWSERLRSMQSLHMVFRQEKHLRVLRQPLMAQGELWLKGETLLYVLTKTAGATELIVRLDKQTVQTYYPLLQTLEVIDLPTTGGFPHVLPFWYPEPDALTRDYEVDLSLDSCRTAHAAAGAQRCQSARAGDPSCAARFPAPGIRAGREKWHARAHAHAHFHHQSGRQRGAVATACPSRDESSASAEAWEKPLTLTLSRERGRGQHNQLDDVYDASGSQDVSMRICDLTTLYIDGGAGG